MLEFNYHRGGIIYMEKQKNNNKTYLLITLGVLGAIMLTLGLTYAYWRLTREQTNENVVTTACLDVEIESQQDDINLQKAFPVEDSEGEKLQPFKFTIHNKCQDYANFQINLESMEMNGDIEVPEDERLNPKYLKFKLNEVEQNGITRLLTGSKEDDTAKVTPTITNAYDAHKLMSGYIEPNGSKNFEFRLWMDGETMAEETDSMNKTLVSKISVTSTYLDVDKLPPTVELALSVCEKDITVNIIGTPTGNKSIKKYEYKIDNNGWQDGSEVNEILNQSTGSHTIKARVTDNLGIVSEEVEQQIEIINKEPEMVEIAGMQLPIAICKNGLYKVEHNDLEELGQEWNKTEYRYAGVNYTSREAPYVHNYVEFNNEKWQIIGLVNVKTESGVEQRVKIIRTDEGQTDFGNYAWDYNVKNNWVEATLKNMLNGIYYESGSGDCYIAEHTGWTSEPSKCDFSGNGYEAKGLDEEARQMIDSEVIWNIGGSNQVSTTMVEKLYEDERGTITYEGNPAEWTKDNDEAYHNGIGLIYLSDYGYATSGGLIGRKECLTKELEEWGRYYSKKECSLNDWLLSSSSEIIGTLTTFQKVNNSYTVGGFGDIYSPNSGGISNTIDVYPVAYLIKDIKITGGTGEFNSPYQLSVN